MALMWDEVADIGTFLKELGEDDFDTPSLCEGWRVRDVLGHMGLGHTTPMPRMVRLVAKHGFNVPKASREESITLFEGKSGDDIRRFWSEVMVAQHPRKGISKLIPTHSGFFDHLVHNQDMRRPTGRRRDIPSDRMVRALELGRTESGMGFSPKKNVEGLRLVASDLGWSAGDGPKVEGAAEAIVMATAGRQVALGELEGDGVAVLRTRLAG
jgi:uncharacterized protein (TIGR03083 family)